MAAKPDLALVEPETLGQRFGGRGEAPSWPAKDIGLAISTRRQNANEYLGFYLDAQAAFDTSSRLPTTSAAGRDLAVGGREPPLSKAEAGVAASHDQLQMQIVPLLGLLEQARSKAGRQAAHSGLYLLAAIIARYSCSRVSLAPSPLRLPAWPAWESVSAILWGSVAFTSALAAFRAVMWTLAHRRLCRTKSVRERLVRGELRESDRAYFGESSWKWVEWCAGDAD